jgi:hypothetical protein
LYKEILMDIVNAVTTSFAAALALVFSFVPKLVGFLVILIIGLIVASALRRGVTFLLRKFGFDRIADRIGLTRFAQQMDVQTDAADILGRIVYWFILLIFLVPAVNALGLTSVSALLNQIVDYLPNVFVAILILFLGTLAAAVVADIVRGASASAGSRNPNLFANLARYAIIAFVAIVALEQLGIATALLNILFTAVIGAAALAAAIAFGLGGQETARKYLGRMDSSLNSAASSIAAQNTNTVNNPVNNTVTNDGSHLRDYADQNTLPQNQQTFRNPPANQ